MEKQKAKMRMDRNQRRIAKEAIAMMEKGYPLGKILYKERSELYEWRTRTRKTGDQK